MMFRSRAAQTTILATGSALAFMAAAVGDHAQAQGNLDASYTISFARIPVGKTGTHFCGLRAHQSLMRWIEAPQADSFSSSRSKPRSR